MSLRREIRQVVQQLLLAALAVDGATIEELIPANDGGPRPPVDYITIRVLSVSDLASLDHDRSTNVAGNIDVTGRQLADARIALQAFGEVAVGWLESLRLRLGWVSVSAVAAARATSPLRDLTEFLDTRFEPRAEMEIGVHIAISDDQSETLVNAADVELDMVGDIDPIVDTYTFPVE